MDGRKDRGAGGTRPGGVAQWNKHRKVLDKLQTVEEVWEAALRPAADQPRAQGGLPYQHGGTREQLRDPDGKG